MNTLKVLIVSISFCIIYSKLSGYGGNNLLDLWTGQYLGLKMVNSRCQYFFVEGGFCVFWMVLPHFLNKGGNLSIAALLSHWVSRVVLSQLQLILLVIWLFDKMLLCFLGIFVNQNGIVIHTHSTTVSVISPKVVTQSLESFLIFNSVSAFLFFSFLLVCSSSNRSKIWPWKWETKLITNSL